MTLPKAVRDSLGISGGDSLASLGSEAKQSVQQPDSQNVTLEPSKEENQEEKLRLKKLFSEGFYGLIPSFFKTLIALKKQKQEFAIVFRTYGNQLEDVVLELNKFCQGEHPCFNGRNGTPSVRMDGHNYTKDFRIKDELNQCGHIYRTGADPAKSVLLLGSKFIAPGKRPNFDEINHIINEDEDESMKIEGSSEIYHHILETLKKTPSMVI